MVSLEKLVCNSHKKRSVGILTFLRLITLKVLVITCFPTRNPPIFEYSIFSIESTKVRATERGRCKEVKPIVATGAVIIWFAATPNLNSHQTSKYIDIYISKYTGAMIAVVRLT